MEEAQEKDMDNVASFKSGKSLTIPGGQYDVCAQSQMVNLLVSSNRYGYIFYATESNGLAIIPSAYIDKESSYLSKSSDDDDDDDDNQNQNLGQNSIIHRPYLPTQMTSNNISILPCWICLNADDSILALILLQLNTRTWYIVFYDVVKLIQMTDPSPLCLPMNLSNDEVGGTIQNLAWNPAITNMFAYIDGHGAVSTYEIDESSKQLKFLGKCDANDDNSSICWSPKGKQIVVVKYDGTLELYEPSMKLKKRYASASDGDTSWPPCINVVWISTHQFLLNYSENSPDENSNENSFFQLMVTYEKDQIVKRQIYNDLFFDTYEAPANVYPQYFHLGINQNKIIICGLSKSLKINVLGCDELNQNSLNIWTFADQFRAIVKSSSNSNDDRPILTGMALGLNSNLLLPEGNTKLPPSPMLLLSNSNGLLQVYYFINKNLPSICRSPEILQPIQAPQPGPIIPVEKIMPTSSLSNPLQPNLFTGSSQLTTTTTSSNNTFSFANFGFSNSMNNSQPVEKTSINISSSIQSSVSATNGFSFNTDLSKSLSMNNVPKATSIPQPTTIKSTINNESLTSTVSKTKALLQMVNDVESKLKMIQEPLSKISENTDEPDQSVQYLITNIKKMADSIKTSTQSIKTMKNEHIEYQTKVEEARRQMKLSQSENLFASLKNRELDPWTESRLCLIQAKYEKLKHDLNVLIQLTSATIHNKSFSNNVNDSDSENEDFMPDYEILDTTETFKTRIKKRMKELSHKVTVTEKDVSNICQRLNTDILSSKQHDFNSPKTTTSSTEQLHLLDFQILEHLKATHPKVRQVNVSSTPIIELSSKIESKQTSTIEQNHAVTIEPNKSQTSFLQQSTMIPSNSPSTDLEGFQNMLRIVRTSIDLFSGATSPEQLRELSNTIARSPLSSDVLAQRSLPTTINTTPTMSKAANLTKSSTSTRPATANLLQTPVKTTSSPIPNISVTPATPTTQTMLSDAQSKLQANKSNFQINTDQARSQTNAPKTADDAVRSLLTSAVSSPLMSGQLTNQPSVASTTSQANKSILSTNTFPMTPTSQSTQPTTIAVTSTISTTSPATSSSGSYFTLASALPTSVQSTSPTMKVSVPGVSNVFGAQTSFGTTGFNLTPTTSSTGAFDATTTGTAAPSFGSVNVALKTTTSTPNTSSASTLDGASILTATPFSTTIVTPTTPTTTSTLGTGLFGAAAPATSTPFGTTTTSVTTTTAATSSSVFGGSPFTQSAGSFGTPTTAAPTTSIFGTSTTPSTGVFGTTSTAGTNAFGSAAAPSTGAFGSGTTSTSPFGNTFGANTSSAPSSTTFSGFGANTSSAPTSTTFSGFGANTSSAPSSTTFSGFGANTSSAPSSATFSGFGANTSSAPTSTTSSGFGTTSGFTTPASTANTGIFGSSGFSFASSAPTTSTAQSTAGSTGFGSRPTFGSNFTGFGTQSNAAGSSNGFSFGGFGGSQPADATQSGFGSFGAATSTSPVSSIFGAGAGAGAGGSVFGGAPAQPSGFGSTSPFGASSTQTASSPSFTAYRK